MEELSISMALDGDGGFDGDGRCRDEEDDDDGGNAASSALAGRLAADVGQLGAGARRDSSFAWLC
jgi:hypothetical protein